MNDGILAKKIKKKSLLYFLLSLPFFIAGIIIVIVLSGSGFFSVDGYFKPENVYSLNKINHIVDSPIGYSSYTISLTATADNVVDTGIEDMYDDIRIGNYVGAYIDGKYILCLISKSNYDAWAKGEGYTFTGTLYKADPEVISIVISDMAKDNISESDAKGLLYGYMIDTRNTGFVGRTIEYLPILFIWLLGIFFLIRGLRPILNINSHASAKKLAKYGTVEYILAEIEDQLTSSGDVNTYRVGKKSSMVFLLGNWIVIESLFDIKFLKAADLLQANKMKQTIKHFGIITTGVCYYAMLNCKGNIVSVSGDEYSVDRLLDAISEKYSWTNTGYSTRIIPE